MAATPSGPVIRFADLSPSPWLNGAGRTVELAAGAGPSQDGMFPDGTSPDGGWDWRLSLADVDRPAPFSRLPGIRRILTIVDGGPLDLTVDGVLRRVERYRPFAFDGGAATLSALPAGPVRNLNLMLGPSAVRGTVHGSVDIVPVTERLPVEVCGFQLAVLLAGEATAAGRRLERFDTVLGHPGGETVTGTGQLALVSIR
ncbi:hypothetical protein GCM10023081_13510 [Arthrobacter ginkgonis]|uniref:HutD family protein n=1 Tax=Arthrobacter ginkgonis TaxID=1630594 RepID=A0ABP7C1H2_9MICC